MVARSGQTIEGYELHEKVAETGFAMVYRATQLTLNREVAIKIILPTLAKSPEFMARFRQEAKLVAELNHPHIVPLLDFWRDGDSAYLVMPWMKGGSLRDKLKKEGALPAETVATVLDYVTAALEAAHNRNIIHRDVKPDNIMLDEYGYYYLGDFGIAKDLSASHIDTNKSEILGTLPYLPSELFDSQLVTPQVDIYSLGVLIYELLNGVHPFDKMTHAQMIHEKVSHVVPRLVLQPLNVADQINVVIQRTTHKDVNERYTHARQVAEAFHKAISTPSQTVSVPLRPETPSDDLKTRELTPVYSRDLKARLYTKADQIVEKPRHLFGREEALARVHRHLNAGESVLLHGLGGMGKTSLAATVAAQRISDGKGDVIWLEAGNEDAETLCEAIARAFNQQEAIARYSGEDRLRAIRDLLADKRALLVLDNVWNHRALYAFLRVAVPPSMPVLVTSRQRLPLEGALVDVNELEAEEALKLLSYHAGNDYSGDETARTLCQTLGWHPFAIEIAGKRLKMEPHLTPTQLIESIADAPHDLKLPDHFADVGREGVKELLDDSVNELNEESRAVFAAMGGMFGPTATLELLALALKRDLADVEVTARDLQQRGLAEMQPRVERVPAHYRLHDLTYSYARVIFFRQWGDHAATIAAARQFIAAHLHDFDDLEFEQSNLLGAANAARRNDDLESLIDLMKMLAVDGYLDARGHSLLFLQRLDDAIEAADTLEMTETRHYLLSKRGNIYAIRGDLENALNAYEEAYKLAPNPNREAILLSTIGGIRFQQNADDHDSYFERAIEIAKKNADDVVLSHALMNRGLSAQVRGNLESAHAYLSQAVEAAERISIPGRLSTSIYNLGMVEVDLGQFHHALENHQRAYTIAIEEDDHFMIATAYSGMACAYHGLGEPSKAQVFFDKALAMYRKQEAARYVTWVINFMEKEHYVINPKSD